MASLSFGVEGRLSPVVLRSRADGLAVRIWQGFPLHGGRLSEHLRAPAATAKAPLAILVGAPVSAFAGDAVTGFVAGVGAGGIVAMRTDVAHNWKARAIAVLAVSACVFILLRSTTIIALLLAPVLPFTSIGVADHLSERRREREARA
jgi:hypothetical protein